jgi:hypothetical protein
VVPSRSVCFAREAFPVDSRCMMHSHFGCELLTNILLF